MEKLKKILLSEGANLVGFADMNGMTINKEMPFGISVVVKVSAKLIISIYNGPNVCYYEEYHRINNLLDKIVTRPNLATFSHICPAKPSQRAETLWAMRQKKI
jgi:hypothetical protein